MQPGRLFRVYNKDPEEAVFVFRAHLSGFGAPIVSQDVFTEVTPLRGGCGGGIAATLFGLILIALAVIVLFTNERDAMNRERALDQGRRIVVTINPNAVLPSNDGKLVHVTAIARTSQRLGDPVFPISMNVLKLKRKAAMFQWREDQSSEIRETPAGRAEVTTYRYVKGWTVEPSDSGGFRYPKGHHNPPMPYRSQEFVATRVTCGAFSLSRDLIGNIDNYQTLLAPGFAAQRSAGPPGKFVVYGNEFYRGHDPRRRDAEAESIDGISDEFPVQLRSGSLRRLERRPDVCSR